MILEIFQHVKPASLLGRMLIQEIVLLQAGGNRDWEEFAEIAGCEGFLAGLLDCFGQYKNDTEEFGHVPYSGYLIR